MSDFTVNQSGFEIRKDQTVRLLATSAHATLPGSLETLPSPRKRGFFLGIEIGALSRIFSELRKAFERISPASRRKKPEQGSRPFRSPGFVKNRNRDLSEVVPPSIRLGRGVHYLARLFYVFRKNPPNIRRVRRSDGGEISCHGTAFRRYRQNFRPYRKRIGQRFGNLMRRRA